MVLMSTMPHPLDLSVPAVAGGRKEEEGRRAREGAAAPTAVPVPVPSVGNKEE